MTDQLTLHEQAQQQRMLALLRERVNGAGGFLPFAEYVRTVLYAPGVGYYSGGARKFGTGGDFTTAPETSPLFGACIAAQCGQVLRAVDDGDILELGAGTGRLAADVLAALDARGAAPRRYRILEVSAELRDRQRATLAPLPASLRDRVEWLDTPPSAPWRGVLVANEVLDALPFDRVRYEPDGTVTELGVGLDGEDRPGWRERPATGALGDEALRVAADLPETLEPPYVTELCRQAGPWVQAVTASLAQGIALLVDYGLPRAAYYHPARDGGTLRCHYRQQAHDNPFFLPGLQDITAWVDFTRVAEAADAAGLDVLGFATQAAFLLGLGIEAMVGAVPDGVDRARRAGEARRLLMPDEMGESFKVIALGRAWDTPLAGFAHQDLRGRL